MTVADVAAEFERKGDARKYRSGYHKWVVATYLLPMIGKAELAKLDKRTAFEVLDPSSSGATSPPIGPCTPCRSSCGWRWRATTSNKTRLRTSNARTSAARKGT
jgi:hypothetical protein